MHKSLPLPARLLGILLVLLPVAVTAQGPPATLVVTDVVGSHEFHDQITLVGRTEARLHSNIVAEIPGRVVAIEAPEGNAVREGQPLVLIDSTRLALEYKSASADAERAKQQAFLAQSNLTRAEELREQKLISQSTIDSARAWAKSAEAEYQRLAAERDQLEVDLERTVIRAPYSGYTLRRTVDVGEWVNPGTPVFQMVDISSITVEVDLPERYYNSLSTGTPVSIVVSGDPEFTMSGKVTGIARSANETTHTFPVLIDVPNPKGRLAGGKLVRATLNLNQKFQSLAVDKDAIVRDGSNTMVYTINDGAAAIVPVTIKSTNGRMVAISSPSPQLQKGMTVIVRGNERVYPGAPVKAKDADSADKPGDKSSSPPPGAAGDDA